MNTNAVLSVVAGALVILLIPLTAMQFTSEVQWTLFDFLAAFVLLAGTGLAYLAISHRSKSVMYKTAAAITAITALLLIWVNGAVGLIGSEDNDANLLYGAVIAVLFLGAIITGLKARGMSYVVFLAALTQLLVPLVAYMIWQPQVTGDFFRVIAVSSFFAVLWTGAGLLFRRASSY